MKDSLLSSIGNTPLVQIDLDTTGKIFAKLEYLNPGGSIKDRSAKYLVENAEKEGLLKPGGTIIDASSGNHGIALAMIGRIKNYKVIITVSEKISNEKYQTLKAYGAEVIVCKATSYLEDPQSYHSVAKRLNSEIPDSFMPNQYYNTKNRDAHECGIAPEIWNQTEGKITHFFAGAGTTGTISGVGRFLKKQNPNIQIIAIDSINSFRATNGNPKPYEIEGVGMDFETPVFDESVVDEIINVSDTQAINMLKYLSNKKGLLVGPSSGAVAAGLFKYAPKLKANDLAVIIFGDSGRAYLSKNFYCEDSNESISIKEETESSLQL
jgi:cystathionine beta-synthase